jgi:Tfp pilus assembly protein PilO
MVGEFQFRKRVILGLLGIVLLLDVALAVVSWRLATAPQTPRQELNRLLAQEKMLEADIKRAKTIRENVPRDLREFDQFEKSFPAKGAGYSDLLGDLGNLAKRAGLQTENLEFKEQGLAGRGLTEVDVTATVNGDYPSVVRFINGLQRSEKFYILDDLTLATAAQNPAAPLRVNLHLKTYFRI